MFLAGFDDHRKGVTTPTADVSYLDVGAGPPALFMHGLATNAYVWQNLIGHLSDVRRCIAVDLPLHDQSPARPQQQLTIGAFADVLHQICEGLDLPDDKLFFPHERAADLAPHIRRRWMAQ